MDPKKAISLSVCCNVISIVVVFDFFFFFWIKAIYSILFAKITFNANTLLRVWYVLPFTSFAKEKVEYKVFRIKKEANGNLEELLQHFALIYCNRNVANVIPKSYSHSVQIKSNSVEQVTSRFMYRVSKQMFRTTVGWFCFFFL